jgi:hypothetical protein
MSAALMPGSACCYQRRHTACLTVSLGFVWKGSACLLSLDAIHVHAATLVLACGGCLQFENQQDGE